MYLPREGAVHMYFVHIGFVQRLEDVCLPTPAILFEGRWGRHIFMWLTIYSRLLKKCVYFFF